MLRYLALLSLLSCLLPWRAEVHAQAAIGIYTDLTLAGCHIQAPAFQATPFYIVARGASALTPTGVNGAEFRVIHDISSTDALFNSVANPAANVFLGDPFGDGTNIAFPSCQDVGDAVELFRVELILLSPSVQDRLLQVGPHATPSNVNFSCPLVNLCDAPLFTALCVTPLFGCINDTLGQCAGTPVEEFGWGAVKSLFR